MNECDAATETPVKQANSHEQLYWVGIGASAGGLEALRELIKQLPKDAHNITYLVAQHLSPKHQSMLVQLLARETSMRLEEAKDGIKPKPGVIYITPPNSDLFIKDRTLRLRVPPSAHSPKPSVDFFFTTLAEELGDHAIGVILSGTGSDGAHGVRAIRAEGGLTIAQVPESAKYDGMPNNAIGTGCIDITLSPDKIGPKIGSLIRSPHNTHLLEETDDKRTAMQELLYLLKKQTGVDFTDYKSGTLFRRLNRRMTACSVDDIDQYLEYIVEFPNELEILFRDMMITVTQFFRDKNAFEELSVQIKELLLVKKGEGSLRIWVPGCATGEEAYSIVILFAEAAGGLHKLQQHFRFQLFATDIDMDALALARKGIYAETTLESMTPELKDRYFHHRENAFEVVKGLREMVVFSKHNVFNDPPFLRLDLISCRNLLIYFNNKLQGTVMNLFHYAMNPTGVLFLGKSEALGHSASLFQSSDSNAKLYKRKLIARADSFRPTTVPFTTTPKLEEASGTKTSKTSHELPDALISALSPDSLLIDEHMDVLRIYGDMQAYTQLSAGVASTNLMSLARKEFRQELRALVYKVLREGTEQSVLPKKLNINGSTHKVNIAIRRLSLKNSPDRLLLISFEKVIKIQTEGETQTQGTDPVLAELEQELTATREHLQTVVEELETSNEELQSTNEELQSTNEELQSSNEELETANEELQSTNEELLTVNEELQVKSVELIHTNESLDNIKESVEFPLLVVNKQLIVTQYNKSASSIFAIESNAEGKALSNIPTHIATTNLINNVKKVITTGVILDHQVSDENSHYYERILPYRDQQGDVNGAILTYMDNATAQIALQKLQESEERYNLAVEGSNSGIWDWSIESGAMHWSPMLMKILQIQQEDFQPSIDDFTSRIHDDDREDVLAILDAHLTRGFEFNVEFRMRKNDGTYIWTHARGQAIWGPNKIPLRMTGSIYDTTERRKVLESLTSSNKSLERFAYVCSHDLREPARLIENFAHLLHSEYTSSLDETANEYVQFIQNSSKRMQEMIKGVLNYSQLTTKHIAFQSVDINSEVANVLENLKFTIEETKAEVIYSDLPTLRADRMQIFQLLQNLIGNALKFCRDQQPTVEITAHEKTNEWVFAIKDNGIGIKPDHTGKIFDVFQRLNNQEDFEGCGIGLSICQQIANKHGGRIWVESKFGEGSTFYFTIAKPTSRGYEHYA